MIKREKISRGGIRMSKLSRIVLFAVTFLTFIISVKLFWNMGVYVDEAGTSPYKVCGGDFWLYMDWLRLLLLLTISAITFKNIFETLLEQYVLYADIGSNGLRCFA